MSDVTIFHNPRCSKSRQALALLEEAGVGVAVRLYLEDTPSEDDLRDVLAKLGLSAADILRKGEEAYKAHFKGITDEAALISLLAVHPKVIERPIIIKGDKAVIGRPPEAVLTLLAKG
jgi:arsenate reductase